MAKTKVTVKFELLEIIDGFMDGSTKAALGNAIVDAAKELIAGGQSPVRGYGRFERYKDAKKYPGKLKDQRPVNLYLTGKMIAGYGWRNKSNTSIEVGMTKGSSKDKEIAGYHNDGTDVMAQRKIVPADDEEWNVSIMNNIRDLYSNRLASLIRQSNKKS